LNPPAKLRNANLLEECTHWETWGKTPGGVVYSLNPIDQARILAVGFHQVILAFVKKCVPIIFLDFPRMIDDGEYLYDQLKHILGADVDRAVAMAVYQWLKLIGKHLSRTPRKSRSNSRV
jgi:hypothetical protein